MGETAQANMVRQLQSTSQIRPSLLLCMAALLPSLQLASGHGAVIGINGDITGATGSRNFATHKLLHGSLREWNPYGLSGVEGRVDQTDNACGEPGQTQHGLQYTGVGVDSEGKSWDISQTFAAGDSIKFRVAVTANHGGIMELRYKCTDGTDPSATLNHLDFYTLSSTLTTAALCYGSNSHSNIWRDSEGCYEPRTLKRTNVPSDSNTYHPSHPEWYVLSQATECMDPVQPSAGSGVGFDLEYRLPDELSSCGRVTVQWWWQTSNGCIPEAWREWKADDAFPCETSQWPVWSMATCSAAAGTKASSGEQFVNCIDMGLLPPADVPTPAVTVAPSTAAPTEVAVMPSEAPTTAPNNDCGSGCASCVSVAGNCANATNVQCAACAQGQWWWPCNVQGACKCASPSTAAPSAQDVTEEPSAAVTGAPSVQEVTEEPSAVTDAPSVVVTSAPTSEAPSAPSTSCKTNCESCVSITGNPHSANDAQCAPCANGGQSWWPCNIDGLCRCAAPAVSTAPTTASPTPELTATPTGPPSPPTPAPSSSAGDRQVLEVLAGVDWSDILKAQQPDLSWKPSSVYKSADLILAVQKMIDVGVGQYKLLAGDSDKNAQYALVNIAAFLAQSMHETIQYDACDENNWDSTSGYTAANACGQLGQSYQDYKCSPDEEHMQCEVDPDMEMTAGTHAKWYGAPAPFFCGPKAKVPKAPKWSTGGWCDPSDWPSWTPWETVQDFFDALAAGVHCKDYQNQKAGFWEECAGEGCPNAAAPNFGQPARTDVEGCCWWGRGVIQTTGVCNFGKLNYFAGARAAKEGRTSLFPDVDFCRTPDQICTSTEHPDLKWVAGLFYWTKEVQGYPEVNAYNFDYLNELKSFTDSGNLADSSFIDKCSGIVNRGCPSRTSCPAGAVHEVEKRAANFRTVLSAFGFPWASRRADHAASVAPPVGSSCTDGCAACVSVFQNSQSATDDHCAKCAHGQTSWPCKTDGLCTCLYEKAVDPL